MKETILPIAVSLLLLSLSGCSLISPEEPLTPEPEIPSIPPSGYEPQASDSSLKRDKVYLELDNSTLMTLESYPVQVSAMLNGNLSDPCHQLRVVVTANKEKKRLDLEVYSVFDPTKACITVLQPFTATIPLGNYAGGHYTVNVNGELLGEFDA